MRKFTVLALSILVFGAFALAQDGAEALCSASKTEFLLGYSYQYADTSGHLCRYCDTVTVTSTT